MAYTRVLSGEQAGPLSGQEPAIAHAVPCAPRVGRGVRLRGPQQVSGCLPYYHMLQRGVCPILRCGELEEKMSCNRNTTYGNCVPRRTTLLLFDKNTFLAPTLCPQLQVERGAEAAGEALLGAVDQAGAGGPGRHGRALPAAPAQVRELALCCTAWCVYSGTALWPCLCKDLYGELV
jgi:hypothetical protein